MNIPHGITNTATRTPGPKIRIIQPGWPRVWNPRPRTLGKRLNSLEGRHILITGGSRGLGAEAARECAVRGASVSVTYISQAQAAKDLCAEIKHNGGRAMALKAEAREEEALKTAVAKAVGDLGPLNGLVVSAGIFEHAPISTMSLDFWDRVLGINLGDISGGKNLRPLSEKIRRRIHRHLHLHRRPTGGRRRGLGLRH